MPHIRTFGMPLGNPPTLEASASERLNDMHEPHLLGELRRRAVSYLIEHDCTIPDPEELDLIVKSALTSSFLLFSAALYHPGTKETFCTSISLFSVARSRWQTELPCDPSDAKDDIHRRRVQLAEPGLELLANGLATARLGFSSRVKLG